MSEVRTFSALGASDYVELFETPNGVFMWARYRLSVVEGNPPHRVIASEPGFESAVDCLNCAEAFNPDLERTDEKFRWHLTEQVQAQKELAWRWQVQQAIWHDLIEPHDNEWTTWSDAVIVTEHVADTLEKTGYVVIKDDPHHFVTFDEKGWFVEHSVQCRIAGTIGTCAYNAAIRKIADASDSSLFGRHLIVEIDEELLPSLEKA